MQLLRCSSNCLRQPLPCYDDTPTRFRGHSNYVRPPLNAVCIQSLRARYVILFAFLARLWLAFSILPMRLNPVWSVLCALNLQHERLGACSRVLRLGSAFTQKLSDALARLRDAF
jgi:hypothetical protein